MGKKYLEIKENSLESSVFNILHGIQEEKEVVAETNKNDKSDDGDGMDAVQPKAVKKKFANRKDKDIDNDGDVDSSDKYLHKRRKAVSKAITKKEGNAFGMALKSAKDKGEKTFVVSGKTYSVKEEVDLDEGKMSQMHQMIKDKKTPAQIAKAMGLDLKTVKALMDGYNKMVPESFEIGTEKYLKHTVETTPGQKEWTETVTKKASSMRETLAKVWEADVGKSPFQKNAKEDLTKGVKGGKTMTGKKVAAVDTSPIIKEKKK
jgi:hypothetical protein